MVCTVRPNFMKSTPELSFNSVAPFISGPSFEVKLLSLWKVNRDNGEAWLIHHHCFIDYDNMPWAIVSKMLDPKWRMLGLE